MKTNWDEYNRKLKENNEQSERKKMKKVKEKQ